MKKVGSVTAKPQRKPRGRGVPFKPNNPITGERDERINRLGTIKPRSQKELEAMLDQIFDAQIIIKDSDGKKYKMSELQSMLMKLARSRNVSGPIHLLERRFGKVKQPIDIGGDGKIIVRLINDEKD